MSVRLSPVTGRLSNTNVIGQDYFAFSKLRFCEDVAEQVVTISKKKSKNTWVGYSMSWFDYGEL